MQKKVSICIPCFNGAKFIERLFDSILKQTYLKLQVILVNDGSTDQTEEIVNIQKKRLLAKGIEFIYLYQENHGQASAINRGLPYVDGEYFMWMDCDDYFECDHVRKKVDFLEAHPECILVRCKGNMYEEDNLEVPVGILGDEEPVGTLFEDILFAYRSCQCGMYMIRSSALFELIPEKKIHESAVGQNMQILLPVTIKKQNGYIPDVLYNYVVREDSHSHSFHGGFQWKRRMDDLEDMKRHMIHQIPMSEGYKEHLLYILTLQMLDMRIQYLDEQILERDKEYGNALVKQYEEFIDLREISKGRKIYFWGAYDKTYQSISLLEMKEVAFVEGIIESDPQKVDHLYHGKPVISKEEIDPKEMYLIIPIRYYADLLEFLTDKGFQRKEDYFYFAYEIQKAIREGCNDGI